tara:strand:- start:1871 stop:3430 length:1560 start_codon:yes stop_codon:yes gene_type:complete
MKFYNTFKEKLILMSVINLTILKLWTNLGVFNYKNNYFSLQAIDKKFFFLEIFIFILIFTFLFYLLKASNKFIKTIIFFLLIVFSLNAMRSITNFNTLSISFNIINIFILIIFFLFFLFFYLKNKDKYNNYIKKIYNFLGIMFLPFFFITLLKIAFGLIYFKNFEINNFYKTNHFNINNQITKNQKDLVLWIIFDQLDQSLLYENLEELPNFKNIINISDVYQNYNPKSFETIRAIPAVTNGIENPTSYKFKLNNRNIDLYLGDNKQLNKISETNSIFEKYFQKNYKTYINAWYIPHCQIFKKYLSKCFQVPYGNNQTLSMYTTLSELFFYHLYVLLPGSSHLYEFDFFKKILKNLDNYSFTFNWYKKNFLLQKENFLNELSNGNSDFIFHHSIMAHPPIIYNKDRNKLFNNYEDSLVYLRSKNLSTELNDYNLDNIFLLDEYLGEISDILRKKNIFNNTTIIINGDTGLSENFREINSENIAASTLVLIKNKNQKVSKIINTKMGPDNLYKKIINLAN